MAVELVVPQVGEAVAEVTIVEWLKKPGDVVKKGEVLFLVDTDKAIVEVEAFTDGVLVEISAPDGSAVMPRQVVGILSKKGESIERSEPNEIAASEVKSLGDVGLPKVSPVAVKLANEMNIDLTQIEGSGHNGRIMVEDVHRFASNRVPEDEGETSKEPKKRMPITPKARLLAEELGVNISMVVGTGKNGLINTQDVEKAAAQRNTTKLQEQDKEALIPYTKRRRAIAKKMLESKQSVPHFYLMADVDMTQVVRLRNHCVEKMNWDRPPTYTDVIVRACALSLSKMPEVNALFGDEGAIRRNSVDIGIAVGLDDGLIVPVLANADQISLQETSKSLRKVIERVNEGRLHEGDLGQKSMVVSNLGMYGVDAFIAIIDIPDPMILAVGRVRDRVVPFEGQPIICPYCTLTLSIDHRALDGVLGAKFLQRVTGYIEDPFKLLV